MSEELPHGFLTLDSANETFDQDVNVMAVVVDFLQPSMTRGQDWQLSLGLQDPSILATDNSSSGMRCKFFAPQTLLPRVNGEGDIVLIRRVRRKQWSGSHLLLSNRATEAIVFPAAHIPDAHFKHAYNDSGDQKLQFVSNNSHVRPPTTEEQQYAIFLRKWALENITSLPPPASHPPPTTSKPLDNVALGEQKRSILSRVTDSRFYDLVGEVVKIYMHSAATSVYLTDYTTNALFFHYNSEGDQPPDSSNPYDYATPLTARKWRGPLGKMTIQITLWPPHSAWVNSNLSEGQYVMLRNVHVKFKGGHLEGSCHQDRRYPDRVDVRGYPPTDPRFADLEKRRSEYWKAAAATQSKSAFAQLADGPVQETKSKKRKREKKERREKEIMEAQEKMSRPIVNPFSKTGNIKLNERVASANDSKPTMSLSDVVQSPYLQGITSAGKDVVYPFINMNCRALVRVIDFFPPRMEDFSRSLQDLHYNDCGSTVDQPDPDVAIDSLMKQGNWEWAFCLLLEDARNGPGSKRVQLKVLVAGKDAEYLLKMDATDLRKDPNAFKSLREKLWILWGDLEERKRHGELGPGHQPSNLPFECCLQEYGVPDGHGGWIRMHRMFKTTIK